MISPLDQFLTYVTSMQLFMTLITGLLLRNAAFEKDVFGAPTFVVNNKIFWGQDRLEYALEEYNFK